MDRSHPERCKQAKHDAPCQRACIERGHEQCTETAKMGAGAHDANVISTFLMIDHVV